MPEQATEQKRTTTISLRIDPAAAADWRRRATAAGLSMSDWIRAAVDAGQQTNIAPPRRRQRDTRNDADPALMRHLAQIGNNLNQLARALNECRVAGSTVQLVEALTLLRSIEAEAAKLLPALPAQPKPRRVSDAH